ncbi:OsmC family protein [Nocardia arizonensis]|uniref:OsmC family protein n=1 Tax=Nocardia arizonensis TaxID=1141647 RepID=UPI000B17C67B
MTTDLGTPLNDIGDATAAAVGKDPGAALVVFRAEGSPEGTVGSAITLGAHTVHVDEPPALGGTGTAPNPVEFYLSALISCQVVPRRSSVRRSPIPRTTSSISRASPKWRTPRACR